MTKQSKITAIQDAKITQWPLSERALYPRPEGRGFTARSDKFISAGLASVTLLAGVIGGVALFSNAAEARPKPPWIAMEPNISEAQSRMAGRVKEALRVSRKQYPIDQHPNKIKWGVKMRNYVVGNMDPLHLDKLFSGHYFVYVDRPPSGNKYISETIISIKYFKANGQYFSCVAQKNGLPKWWNGYWRAIKNTIGFSGLRTKRDGKPQKNSSGAGVIYDPKTGRALINLSGKTPKDYPGKAVGHFQREWAPVFDAVCGNIPRDGNPINNKQISADYAEFFKDAKPIKGRPVRFEQDIDDPLTLGQYFSLYPPED